MARKVSDTFSWRIAKAKDLLTETDIDRLACVALLCIDNVNVSTVCFVLRLYILRPY